MTPIYSNTSKKEDERETFAELLSQLCYHCVTFMSHSCHMLSQRLFLLREQLHSHRLSCVWGITCQVLAIAATRLALAKDVDICTCCSMLLHVVIVVTYGRNLDRLESNGSVTQLSASITIFVLKSNWTWSRRFFCGQGSST